MAKQERLKTIWYRMIDRCYNKKHVSYKYYGAKDIVVCDEWRNNFEIFKEWALSHGYEDHLTLDRRIGIGNYEPSNCSWKTKKEQQANRHDNRRVEFNGEMLTASEIADQTGKSYDYEYGVRYQKIHRKNKNI